MNLTISLQDKFEQFLKDETVWTFYITGPAGTGKTTSLKQLVDYCVSQKLETTICAFTHKACGILAEKLSPNANICTLHAYLSKRPTINDLATKAQHIEVSRQHGTPETTQVLFVDEFSMVGEQDYMDIVTASEDPETGEPRTKVVYIGDMNQLPPIGDMQTINPNGKWWVQLTHVYRQAEGNELLDLLHTLVKYIGGEEPMPLEANKNFIRQVDLAKQYKAMQNAGEDIVLLAYTNQAVEQWNAEIEGKSYVEVNDAVFSPTNREHYFVINDALDLHDIEEISLAYGEKKLGWDSKYRTLEHLVSMPDIRIGYFVDLDHIESVRAYIFGHYEYKCYTTRLKEAAAKANKECEKFANGNARLWAQANPTHPLAKKRAKAWRDYLTFKECVICLDFPHAMTVHKSQGSTYKYVCIDTDDLYHCAARDFTLYLRLMYVAISRASDTVFTN